MVIGKAGVEALVAPGLEFHPLEEQQASSVRMVQLLQEFRTVLQTDGMADMDEYGDMLKWALPGRDGWCRYFHVYHPGYCSWDDRFYGTVHTHGGTIQGTILAGAMDHFTYDATRDPDGDRSYDGDRYTLVKHTAHQPAGTRYRLPAHVPHWLEPKTLTITYFEEEDNGAMGELVNRDTKETDTFLWEQADADRLMPDLLALIDERSERLQLAA